MARDRYLWNAGEETIHRENRQPPPSKKSKWENFWYYHKAHVAIILIVALLAGEFIREMVLKREPDYEVALLTQSGYSDRFLTALESELEKYGTDLNKDGRSGSGPERPDRERGPFFRGSAERPQHDLPDG